MSEEELQRLIRDMILLHDQELLLLQLKARLERIEKRLLIEKGEDT